MTFFISVISDSWTAALTTGKISIFPYYSVMILSVAMKNSNPCPRSYLITVDNQ